ncbi:MAG: RHS repeat-associated core domain-containing protein, partial [Formivibrio sp.]|nr:RHS repeat-associated core domain-containing protein [Formivibrio sp.]
QYGLNSLNQITNATLGGTIMGPWTASITVAGSTTSRATSVTVNGSAATLHADNTFELYNQTVVNGLNNFTAVAQDVYGRTSTSTSSVNVITNNSAYGYDLNGNLLTDGTRNFAYDDENQLISVWKTNAWRQDFVYDGKMRRRITKEYGWNGTAWAQTNEVHFVYDGNLVVQERDANNVPQVSYTRGTDLSGKLQGAGGIGGLLARTDRASAVPWISTIIGGVPTFGTHSYYHADGNGNITALISASQMIVAKYLYDPFGNTLSMYGLMADINKYRFSSKEWNGNAGLYYYLYRFYDSNLQRWLNRDPFGELGFEAVQVGLPFKFWSMQPWGERIEGPNLFEFARNDGIDFMDTDGMGAMGTIGGTIGSIWKPVSVAVGGALCTLAGYKCAMAIQAATDAAGKYQAAVTILNNKYGDSGEWPQAIVQLMNQWNSDNVKLAGAATTACAHVGGSSTAGPVNNPIR